jgi:hypothetical protein
MANRIEEEGVRFNDPNDLASQIREFVKLKTTVESMESRQSELKEKLIAALDASGYEDDKGNIQLELDEEIEGVYRLEKQRRVKRKLDESRAEELLAELGLDGEVYEMKPVLNEDALMAAFYEEKITEAQLDEIFPLTVMWALRTVKK